MAYLSDRLAHFLRHGGHLSLVVGIDIQNTTREGLQALLELEQHGWCETFVYHNEAGSVFHPKLYLFRNEEEARLIVGSNNITQSGLYVNVEAGLQVDTNANASVVAQTLDALSSWKDTTSGLARRLDHDLLERLSSQGYVPDEATALAKLRRERTRRSGHRTSPLFAAKRFIPPAPVPGVARPDAAPARGRAPLPAAPAAYGRSESAGERPVSAWTEARAPFFAGYPELGSSDAARGKRTSFPNGAGFLMRNRPSHSDADSIAACRYIFWAGHGGSERPFW